MSIIDRQVAVARRRLMTNVVLRWVAIGAFAGGACWCLAILIERIFVLGVSVWHGSWAAGMLALMIAGVGALIHRVPAVAAAIAIDKAAGLKERLSTALVVRNGSDEFARAAVADAEKAAGSLHVPSHLPLRAPRELSWSVGSIVCAVLLALFMPALNFGGSPLAQAGQQKQAAIEEKRNIEIEIERQLNRIKELAQNNPDLKNLTAPIEPLEIPDRATLTPEDVRREAMKKIDSVKDQLAKQAQTDMKDMIADTRRMLSQMDSQKGEEPGSQLSQNLQAGDFEGAKEALKALQKQADELAKKDESDAKQQAAKLAEQLQKLSEQLARLESAQQIQKDLENKAGLSSEDAQKLIKELANLDPKEAAKQLQQALQDKGLSAELSQQLAKQLQSNKEARQQVQDLARSLAQAAQAMQSKREQGDGSGSSSAAQALSAAADQLSNLEMSEQMMNELEAQIAQLNELRDGVCKGSFCEGTYGKRDSGATRLGPQGENYGIGYGSRIGKEKTAHDYKPSKANTRPQQGGEIIGRMLVDGAQMRGEAAAEVRNAVASDVRDAEDAIEREHLPRQYHASTKQYFELLSGLIGAEKPAPQPKPGE